MKLSDTLTTLESIVPSKFEHIVAAELTNKQEAILFTRNENSVTNQIIKFEPFILLKNSNMLSNASIPYELTPLEQTPQQTNEIQFNFLAKFANLNDYKKALAYLKTSTGFTASAPFSTYKVISDLQQQIFIDANFRLFRGMTFNSIRRLQFDIETLTTEGFDFPNPKREHDSIAIISMSDNTGWEECLVLNAPYSEKELLEKFINIVRERDPDVIEGHNIFKFDLPFIEERAKRHKLRLLLGRDESVIKKRPSRFTIAERTLNYPKYEIFGRHIIDTFHLVQHYDVIHRELESFGLKAVAKHFGVASPERTYLEGKNITNIFKQDPEKLSLYALDDVRETRAISNILSPSYFYQTQLIPISYQNCVIRGNASRIESMLLSAYINRKAAIPIPEPSQPFSGALTDAPESGVFENVWHCDIRSLYPSIILADNLIPSRDHLKIFPFLLDKLRSFRLSAKDAEKQALTVEEKDAYNALQTTFKILINSFYGYLGFAQGSFNDYIMADKVTSKGREILTTMLDFLKKDGAKIIEMDTDGIYFQPQAKESTPQNKLEPSSANIAEMEERIQKILPKGIEVELDAVYSAMFSYKSKNYALLHENGEISITGAALKSRGLEPFQRDYMKELIHFMLKKDFQSITQMTSTYRDAISNRKWDLAKFAKTETLQASPKKYLEKIKAGGSRRSAAYELAINSTRNYSQGDQISYYVTGIKKKVSIVENSSLLKDAPEQRNENITYYLGKLDDLFAKFAEFIPNVQDDDNPLGLEF